MSNTSKVAHLSHLDFLRVLCVLTVVANHCLSFLMHDHFPAMKATYLQFDEFNMCGPIVVAMPLFTFISGYLYAYLKDVGKYAKDFSFLKNKSKRLLLPYVFFVVLFCITTQFQHTDFVAMMKQTGHHIFYGGYNHLWYLPVLFWCFVVVRLFEKISPNTKLALILFLIIAFILGSTIPESPSFLNFMKVVPWLYWFLLGYAFFKFKNNFMPLIANTSHRVLVLALTCVFCLEIGLILFFGIPKYKAQFTVAEFVIITVFIIALFIIFEDLARRESVNKIFTSKVVKSVSKYSFGIYIFHYWLAPIIISSTAKRIFHLEAFAEHYYIFPIVFSIVTFVASYVVTYLFQKTKLGKYLLG